MKFRPDPLFVLSAAALMGAVTVIGLVVWREVSPAPVKFDAVGVLADVAIPGERFRVVAETHRRPAVECTNGVQIEIRDVNGVNTRLPIPAREIEGSKTTYIIDLPETTVPGQYGVKIRETFFCGGRPKTEESPWIALEVGE